MRPTLDITSYFVNATPNRVTDPDDYDPLCDHETWPKIPAADPSDCYLPAQPDPPVGGFKFDKGKNRLDLLPFDALQDVARVLTYGTQKGYPESSWRNVTDGRKRYMAAALRHLFARVRGEYTDPESGLPHLAHFACNALFMCALDDEYETHE